MDIAGTETLYSLESVMGWLGGIESEIGVGHDVGSTGVCRETDTSYVEIIPNVLLGVDLRGGLRDSDVRRYGSPGDAWNGWAMEFSRYLTGRSGSLYWRVKPELHGDACGGWCVYARLVIDPPVVEA